MSLINIRFYLSPKTQNKVHNGCDGIRTHNHIVHEQTVNDLAKLANLGAKIHEKMQTVWKSMFLKFIHIFMLIKVHVNQWFIIITQKLNINLKCVNNKNSITQHYN